MPEFIFMLTRDDCTISDALAVYDEVCETSLRYVGFKDIGLRFEQLADLASAIRDDGRKVVLEIVSEHKDDEPRSVEPGVRLGVDYLLGGTHAEEVARTLAGTGIRYFPFPGRVIGHPSQLRGSIEEIVDSAERLASLDGVDGLDLLAYRYDGDVEALTRAVVDAARVPVIAAGAIDSDERIARVAAAGVWGFTIGSAILNGSYPAAGASVREKVALVVEKASLIAATPERSGY